METNKKNEVKKALYKQKPMAKLISMGKVFKYDTKIDLDGDQKMIKFEVPMSDMGDATFGEEIQGRNLIPRCFHIPVGAKGLVTFLTNHHVVVAVPGEVGRHGRGPDLLIIEIDQRTLRIGLDGHGAAYATGQRQGHRDDQRALEERQTGCRREYIGLFHGKSSSHI